VFSLFDQEPALVFECLFADRVEQEDTVGKMEQEFGIILGVFDVAEEDVNDFIANFRFERIQPFSIRIVKKWPVLQDRKQGFDLFPGQAVLAAYDLQVLEVVDVGPGGVKIEFPVAGIF